MPLSAAAAGIIGTIGTSVINAASQARTNAVNKRQAEDAWNKQMAATRDMNVYNSPSMQVARLRAAGLSPSMAYGANGEAVGNQSDIPAFNPIPAEAPKSGDLGAPFITAARLGLETREQLNRDNLAIAELAVKDANAFMMVTQGNVNTATANEIVTLLGYKEQSYINQFALDDARYREIEANIQRQFSEIGLNEKRAEEIDSIIDLNGVRGTEILALLPHQIRQMDANAFMAAMQGGLYKAEVNEVAEKVATLQYNRQLEYWDRQYKDNHFKFEQKQFEFERDKFQKELRVRIEQGHAERVTSIFRIGLGAGMIGLGKGIEQSTIPTPAKIGF